MAALDAIAHLKEYKKYEHLWLTNKDVYLQQFLIYSRALTTEEVKHIELIPDFKVKENKPSLDMFRHQVSKF